MKIVILGGSGFVGRHLVAALLGRGHRVTVVARDTERAKALPWFSRVEFLEADLYADHSAIESIAERHDTVVDLIWPGLPHYQELFHFECNALHSYRMLKAFVEAGTRRLVIAGTCLEYGLQEGVLGPDSATDPHTAYGLGKDILRRSMQQLATAHPFELSWARLFYVYGEGQSPNSLLASLEAAVMRGDRSFPMSRGDQLRDFLPVESAAAQLARLAEQTGVTGCFNICSGVPKSVRGMVDERLSELGASMPLDLGAFPYATHEPMAFWGQCSPELVGGDDRVG